MSSSLEFAIDVVGIVCDRLRSKAADLQLLVQDGYSFEEWLNWEAYLACKSQQANYPFWEVAAKPSYASEGLKAADGAPDPSYGDLRVGGPNEGADHCWVFAEFVLLHDSSARKSLTKIEEKTEKLKRLGWVKSAALLIVVVASKGDGLSPWASDLEQMEAWRRPALVEPCVIRLPDAGSVAVRAIDIKQVLANTLTTGLRSE